MTAAGCSPGSKDQPWGQGEESLIPQYPASSPSPARRAPGAGPVLWSDPLQRSKDWTLGLKRALAAVQKESIPCWVLGVLGDKLGRKQGAGSGVQGSDPSFLTPLPRGCQPWQHWGSPHSPRHDADMWQGWDELRGQLRWAFSCTASAQDS